CGQGVVVIVSTLVVADHFALNRFLGGFQGDVPDPLLIGGSGQYRQFDRVQGAAGITAGGAGDVGQGLLLHFHPVHAQPPLLIPKGALQEEDQLLLRQGDQLKHPRAGQERRVDLEGGVLRRRSDQDDSAVLYIGEKGILLGFVEAVNFVDEQNGSLTVHSQPFLGFLG